MNESLWMWRFISPQSEFILSSHFLTLFSSNKWTRMSSYTKLHYCYYWPNAKSVNSQCSVKMLRLPRGTEVSAAVRADYRAVSLSFSWGTTETSSHSLLLHNDWISFRFILSFKEPTSRSKLSSLTDGFLLSNIRI